MCWRAPLGFRLFVPQRYIEYGMPVAATLLVVTAVGRLAVKMDKARRRAVVGNFAACTFIALFCLIRSSGVRSNDGMTIFWEKDAALYTYVRTLPLGAVISGQPQDLDNIPFWAGRAVLVNWETTHPLLSRDLGKAEPSDEEDV